MFTNIGLYSYGTALLTFGLLLVVILLTWGKRVLVLPAAVAALMTCCWAAVVVASTLQPYPLVTLMEVSEWARNLSWGFYLLSLLGSRFPDADNILSGRRWLPWFAAGAAVSLAGLLLPKVSGQALPLPDGIRYGLVFVTWVALAVIGLLLLEQIFRNSSQQERWSIKHLCFGLGVIFTYDFFMYAEALLFRQLDANLWQARGFVTAISAVFIAVALTRMERPQNDSKLYLSRHVVFHTVTLLAAGIYLLLMALAGYFIQYMGGSWGGVLQIAFLFASGFLLLALLFSGQIRAKLRVWLSKNFFSYKYDYRVEWLQFTRTLARGGENIPENIIHAMSDLTSSPSGALWARSEDAQFRLLAEWDMTLPVHHNDLRNMPQWMENSEWIIDLKEWRQSPDLYEGLEIPPPINDIARAWLIVPLMFGEKLQGILVLRESDLLHSLNWEDRDLLKVAGRQAASHLAQYQANQALLQSRQFDAFNRLSAYVIHDLKNILAQQSLIVSNATKHRDNPAFVDDVIDTVENSVARMTRLMEQMRNGVRGSEVEPVDLGSLLQETIAERSAVAPAPCLESSEQGLVVHADRVQLATVFNHIVQNAQEATGKAGSVTVRLKRDGALAIIEIEDDGIGMEEDFLRNRLFKPFESTKGLTGMGIGAFESREFIRAMGGDIKVKSTPGVGSVFTIVLSIDTSIEAVDKLTGTEQ